MTEQVAGPWAGDSKGQAEEQAVDRLEVGGSCKRERGRGGGERPAVIAELLTAVMVVGRSPRCLPPSSVLSHVAQVSRIIRIRDRRPAPERHGWTARLEMITKLVLVDENVADGTRSIQPMGVGSTGVLPALRSCARRAAGRQAVIWTDGSRHTLPPGAGGYGYNFKYLTEISNGGREGQKHWDM